MAQLNLPPQWLQTQLGDVVFYGKTQKCELSDVTNETWVLELEDIEKESSRIISRKTASERPFKSTKNRFERGNVLYGKLRPYLNKVVVADTAGVCTTEIIPLDSEPFVLNRYLFHWLRTRDFLNYVNEVSYGVNMPRLGTKDGVAAPFALAPLAEQKVIADKLDTLLAQVDNTKARLERIPQILKHFRQSVLAEAVSGRLTEDWRTENDCSLGIDEYLDLIKDFNIKAKDLLEPTQEGNWLCCQLGHIMSVRSGEGLTSKNMVQEGGIPVYGGNGINGYHDHANTSQPAIVIGRVGFYCGSVHRTESKSWITDNAMIVSFPTQLINIDFAYWLLKATNLREDTASSAQPVISGSKIYKIKILLAPVKEQTEIVRRVDQLFAHADRIEQQVNNALARVNKLTQSILAKAFRGELTEQWRQDHPDLISGDNSAEALLQRIKAERAAAAPVKRTRKAKRRG